MATRKAQAMVELAIGMFALVLVLSAMLAFGAYIVRSLDIGRTLRAQAGRKALAANGSGREYSTASAADEVELDSFAAAYLAGAGKLQIKETVNITNMKGAIE